MVKQNQEGLKLIQFSSTAICINKILDQDQRIIIDDRYIYILRDDFPMEYLFFLFLIILFHSSLHRAYQRELHGSKKPQS